MRNQQGNFLAYPILQCSSSLLRTASIIVTRQKWEYFTLLGLQPAFFWLIPEDNRFQFFHQEGKKGDAKRYKDNK